MDFSSWAEDIGEYVSEDESLSAILAKSVSTPSASDWTDTSIHDGAGSDEGDTFKYECKSCGRPCANVRDLCSHLINSEIHTICPICLMEFAGQGPEDKRLDHIYETHSSQLSQHHRSSTNSPTHEHPWTPDFRTVSEAASHLATSIGFGLNDRFSTTSIPSDEDQVSVIAHLGEPEIRIQDIQQNDYSTTDRSELSRHTGDRQSCSNPMVNIVVDHDDRPESYYWEPDPVLVEKSGEVNVEAMKEERDGEMNWLKGFKGV